MEPLRTAALVGGTVAMALFAGLFYTFAMSVMVGLKRTDDRTFVTAMQWINALAAAGEPDRVADLAAVRERFEARWVRWNVARAVTSTAAVGFLAWALVLHGAL